MSAKGAEVARMSGRHGVIAVAVVGIILAAVSLTLAFTIAEGDAREHATFHLFVGLVCLALFGAVGLAWKPPSSGIAWMTRTGLLIVTGMGAIGQLMESIGASGYDRYNAGHEIELLTTLHNRVGILAPIALIAVPLGLIAIAVLVIRLAFERLRAARAR